LINPVIKFKVTFQQDGGLMFTRDYQIDSRSIRVRQKIFEYKEKIYFTGTRAIG